MADEIKINISKELKVLEFLKRKFNWIVYLLLGIIIYISTYIRTLPMKINPSTGLPGLFDVTRNNWTIGPDLDPFLWLRLAKTIIANGALPAVDTMRYIPLGHSTLLETRLLPYSIAYLYKILHIFSSSTTVEFAAIFLPVILAVLMAIGFFLLVRKLFEQKGNITSNVIGLLATLFLVTLPSLLPRTIAGIPDKESPGFMLMFFAFYFFVCAWKSEKTWKAVCLGILAGIFTALMALVWGGVIFVFASIAIFGFILLVLDKIDKKEVIVYSSWILSSFILWLPFTLRNTLSESITAPTTGASIIVFVLILVNFFVFKTKLNNMKIFQNEKIKKIPRIILVIIITAFLLFIISTVIVGPTAMIDLIKGLVGKLFIPYSDRLSYTVAENKQPYFNDWASEFGPMALGLPLFFWLFIVGAIVLFADMIKDIPKGKAIFISGFILSLLALIFSRTSASSFLNGDSTFSKIVYVLGYVIFIGVSYYVLHKNKDSDSLKGIKFENVLLFTFIFVGIIAARSGIRLIMLLALISSIPISYLAVMTVKRAVDKNEKNKGLFVILAIVMLIAVPYTLYYNYASSKQTGENYIPNDYTIQWQYAMSWVRASTPANAVFGSWWDYGYWIQTMGERATMLDGGNSISYWDYLMGRYGLTAPNESTALELLYNHNVSYFLIDSTDISKYGAYASIGSDVNYDRLSFIGSFLVDNTQTVETKNTTTKIYLGGAGLDDDIPINNGTVLLPQGAAGVGALVVPKDTNGTFRQPLAIMVYQGKQYNIQLRYVYYNNTLHDFHSGLNATAYIIPSLVQGSNGNLGVDPEGAAIYLSNKNMNALWVQLYLLNEGKQFKLVHNEPSSIVQSLRKQGLDVGDFVYYAGIQGPIKIYSVNYTGKETFNPEYIQLTYPQSVIDRRAATLK